MAGPEAIERAGPLRTNRRRFLASLGVVGGLILNGRLDRAEAGRYRIEPVEYERTSGTSFPWNPLDERIGGIIATGRNPGGAFDKYDALDRIINGPQARSSYWISTSQWDAQIAQEVVNEGNFFQAGFCLPAATAGLLSPKIEGGIEILGIPFDEFERKQIATMYYGGMPREPFYTEVTSEVVGYVRDVLYPQGLPVVANYYPSRDQDWWGAVSAISDSGEFLITRPITSPQNSREWNRAYYNPYGLRQIAILNSGTPQPDEKGLFEFIDKKVGGLIIGTHQLVG